MDVFRKLGLSKYEDAIYAALLKLGVSDARKIADKSNVPPTAVYPNLRKLAEKELVNEIKGKVSLFKPVSPNISIKRLIKNKEKELNSLEKEAVSKAEELRKDIYVQSKEEVTFTHGKDISREVYIDAFKKTKKTFYIFGWRFEKIDDKYNLLKYFRALVKKKIDVRIILTGNTKKEKNLVEEYLRVGVKLRFFSADNFSIFVRDSEECKITLKERNTLERFNIQFLNKSFSEAMNSYFLGVWNKAEEI